MKNPTQKVENCLQKAKKLISKWQKLPITGFASEWEGVDFAQKISLSCGFEEKMIKQ